jgi:hypothetical protein
MSVMHLGKIFLAILITLALTACGNADKATPGKIEPKASSQLEAAGTPKITASSQSDKLGPEGLLANSSPGWHSQFPPKYPEQITIYFGDAKQFNTVGVYPQSGYADRNPKAFDLEGSMDGSVWTQIISVTDGCRPEHNGWIDYPLKQAAAKYVRLIIKANCGSAYLTLMGLRFQ